MSITIDLSGEMVELRADRSVFWPRHRTLLVADLHFGKAAAFRAASLPVPGGVGTTLTRLSAALTTTQATRLVVLGDLWHARDGRTPGVLAELAAWRDERPGLRIELVKGNHDRAGPPPAGWAESWRADGQPDGPFVFTHHPEPSDRGYVLCGHLHPGYRFTRSSHTIPTLPCFWLRKRYAVLPAFGSFTGFASVSPAAGDRLFVVADNEVISVPT